MRWVISPVVGSGTAEDPYRAKASDYGSHSAVIPGNEDGTPKFNWCLVFFDGDVTAAEADADLTVLPNLTMDHEVTLTQRNWLRTRLQNHGLPYLWVNTGDTVLETLRTIGRYLDEKYDIDWQRVN